MQTNYKGIDYGLGNTNKDKASGIRFGVISQHEVLQAWADSSEPLGFVLDDGEYQAQCGEDGDIFILRSPYFTYAQFCSPCAPGACYLLNTLSEPDDNNRAYCFGADWFEDNKAPYPIYSVETGELLTPESV